MSDLVRQEPFDLWARAYHSIGEAASSIVDARQRTVELQGEPGEDQFASDITDELVSHQRALVEIRDKLLYRARSYGGMVLLRPVFGRVVTRFNDLIDQDKPSGPRSEGLVFSARLTEPVIAPCDGTVDESGVLGGIGVGGVWGKRVCLNAGNGKRVWIAHLDISDVAVGDKVRAGATIIGRAGTSGNALISQVLMVLEDPDGTPYPGLPFKVSDPWQHLYDRRDDDAVYLREPKVEG